MDPLHFTLYDGQEHHIIPAKLLHPELRAQADHQHEIHLKKLDAKGRAALVKNTEIHRFIHPHSLAKIKAKKIDPQEVQNRSPLGELAKRVTDLLLGG